jgi:hypothetical protein
LKQFDLKHQDSDDDDVGVQVHMVKSKDLTFDKNKKGDFILPPMTDYRLIRQKQRVIRGFIGATYRECYLFLPSSYLTL